MCVFVEEMKKNADVVAAETKEKNEYLITEQNVTPSKMPSLVKVIKRC